MVDGGSFWRVKMGDLTMALVVLLGALGVGS